MNILVVSDFYTPGNSRLLEIHGSRLRHRGHKVALLAGSSDPSQHASRLRTLQIDPFLFESNPANNPLSRLFTRITAPLDQYDYYRSLNEEPDVVLFHQPMTALPLLIRNRFENSVYFHHGPWAEEWAVHHPESDRSLPRLIAKPYRLAQQSVRNRIEGWILDHLDRIVVLSEYMKNKVKANHPNLNPSDTVIVPGGVDPDRFRPDGRSAARRYLGWTKETVIFTLRRLVHRMGVDRLIKSFDHMVSDDEGSNLRLVIGGNGPERSNLESLANKITRAPVDFEGFIEDDKLPEYYRAADLFVLPTRELEGFGLVTLEALSSGTPVTATRTGGTEEILSNFDSELFLPDYTPEAWAKKMRKILDSSRMDEEFRERCRNYVLENYTWSKSIASLEEQLTTLRDP